MVTNKQSMIWGNFWQITDQARKLLSDYEKLQANDQIMKELPQIETAYIDSIIIHIAKIFSNSQHESFRLEQFKRICRSDIKTELENVEEQYKDIIGKIITNRNKLIAHLDRDFYKLCFSDNEILRMEEKMSKSLQISLDETKKVYASMPRSNGKNEERYSVGDFRENSSSIKNMMDSLDDIWSRSIPFAEDII